MPDPFSDLMMLLATAGSAGAADATVLAPLLVTAGGASAGLGTLGTLGALGLGGAAGLGAAGAFDGAGAAAGLGSGIGGSGGLTFGTPAPGTTGFGSGGDAFGENGAPYNAYADNSPIVGGTGSGSLAGGTGTDAVTTGGAATTGDAATVGGVTELTGPGTVFAAPPAGGSGIGSAVSLGAGATVLDQALNGPAPAIGDLNAIPLSSPGDVVYHPPHVTPPPPPPIIDTTLPNVPTPLDQLEVDGHRPASGNPTKPPPPPPLDPTTVDQIVVTPTPPPFNPLTLAPLVGLPFVFPNITPTLTPSGPITGPIDTTPPTLRPVDPPATPHIPLINPSSGSPGTPIATGAPTMGPAARATPFAGGGSGVGGSGGLPAGISSSTAPKIWPWNTEEAA